MFFSASIISILLSSIIAHKVVERAIEINIVKKCTTTRKCRSKARSVSRTCDAQGLSQKKEEVQGKKDGHLLSLVRHATNDGSGQFLFQMRIQYV